jgi:hypothetical protein
MQNQSVPTEGQSSVETEDLAGSVQPRLVRHAFPNRAGDHEDTDDVLSAELEAAGITVEKHEFLRRRNREVKTAVIGSLHGWGFERAWYYWVATGPGIELEAAEKLHAAHGRSVRVDGHCGCPSPGEWFKGLACGSYHVDDQEGLNALAETIRELVSRLSNDQTEAPK